MHDLALRADYETAQKQKDYFYDIDAMEHLESFILECDRKVELAKRRLKETQEELSEEASAKAETIHSLGEQIGTKLARAEEMGAKGDVDASLGFLEEVEDLKKKETWRRDGVQELYAGFELPATEAAGVRGVLRLPGHPRQ